MIAHARTLACPSFAVWLQVAAFTGLRPGELDALRWERVDFERHRIVVAEQFSAATRTFDTPKNHMRREAPLTAHARDALPSQARGIISRCPTPLVPGEPVLTPQTHLSIMSDTIAKLDDPKLRFARSATRHRISKDCIRHVIANYRVRFEEPPPDTRAARARSPRVVYLGDDDHGRALEVMAVAGKDDELLVIHAMELRNKYRKRYEDRRR